MTPATIVGRARVDRRTKNLIGRLKPGDVAVIDHKDLDGLAASGLVERRASAVINVSPSISGRYPNKGPSTLLEAGIPLIEVDDPSLMDLLRDGTRVEVDADTVKVDGSTFPARWLNAAAVSRELEAARSNMGAEIEAFARNTLEYITRERHLVVDDLEVPELRTPISGKHCVIVVRGDGFRRDLVALRPYIEEVRPVLIAVDGAADALLDAGLTPHLIVGDMDSVSDRALRCGAEIVVHSYLADPVLAESANGSCRGATGERSQSDAMTPDSEENHRAPGLARLQQLAISGSLFSVAGTSEDMAMLLAYEKGAELIVALGTHYGLVDFLDKGRAGMASTFLVRLRVASRLVDARGVGELYRIHTSRGAWWAIVLAASVPVATVAALSPAIQASFSLWWILLTHWFRSHGL